MGVVVGWVMFANDLKTEKQFNQIRKPKNIERNVINEIFTFEFRIFLL